MKQIYKKLTAKPSSEFQSFYIQENLKAIQTCSLVFLIFNFAVRLFVWVYKGEDISYTKIDTHSLVNWVRILFLIAFFLLSRMLINQSKKKVSYNFIKFFTVSFAFYAAFSGMLADFLSLNNQRIYLTFFMLAMVIVSTVLILKIKELLILIVMIAAAFHAMLILSNVTDADFYYNQFACLALLVGFYFISQYIYAYKLKNFLQLLLIQQNNAELTKAASFKNEVLGIVAHDLRNPIGAVETIVSMMQMNQLDSETEENLSMIKASCVKAMEIVNDLLEAARDESDAELSTTLVNVNDLLQNLLNGWQNQNIRHKIVLKAEPGNIYAQINTEKFHRVLDNLISNAIKFSNDCDLVEVILSENGSNVCIEVKDCGIGIPAHLLPNVFDRFSSSSRKGLRGERSTGLGLNIAQRIVEKHNGTMTVESVEQQGSVFKICLPKADASFTNLIYVASGS